MDRIAAQSSDVLLARVNSELERISDTQHVLARRKQFLQQQATRLRLGASPLEIGLAIRAAALNESDRTGLASSWVQDSVLDAARADDSLA